MPPGAPPCSAVKPEDLTWISLDEVREHGLALRPGLEVRRLGAVHEIAVLAGARAVDRQATQLLVLRVDARRREDDARDVAARRQLLELLGADDGCTRALPGVHRRGIAGHLDRFLHAGWAHREREGLDLPEAQLDLLDPGSLEPGQLHRDRVVARREGGEPEGPRSVGDGADGGVNLCVGRLDRGASQRAAEGIPDDAFDGCPLFLGGGRTCGGQHAEERAQDHEAEVRRAGPGARRSADEARRPRRITVPGGPEGAAHDPQSSHEPGAQ